VIRFIITLVAGCILIGSLGCETKKKKPVVQKTTETPVPPPKPVIKKVEFIPPADSLITATQMKNWLSCNSLLDSLAIMYGDSFKTDDPQKRLRYQEDFSSAQDKICVLSGLTGGYKEYKWVMGNIGNPKNKAVVEASNGVVF
jgi:hypothetical protein